MPILPAPSLVSSTVDIAEIYDSGLIYAPDASPDNLEVLNGGLENTNYNGSDGSIPAYTVQPGAFVCSRELVSTNWNCVYAKQLTPDSEHRVILASVSLDMFVPWDATMIQYGFAGLFWGEASLWDKNGALGGPYLEYWALRFRVNSVINGTMPVTLINGRSYDTVPNAPAVDLICDEKSSRYVSRFGALRGGPAIKGCYRLQLEAWMKQFSTSPIDYHTAKLRTPSVRIYCTAWR
jgi:hypothetical protein